MQGKSELTPVLGGPRAQHGALFEEAEPNSMDLAPWIHHGEEWDALGCAGSRVKPRGSPFWC